MESWFVIEPTTFIGKPPLEKGNLHESAVRKTIGLSPEGDFGYGGRVAKRIGAATSADHAWQTDQIHDDGTDPVDSTKEAFLTSESTPPLPPRFSLPLDAARSSGCLRPNDIGLIGTPPQHPAAGRPQKQISKRHSFKKIYIQ